MKKKETESYRNGILSMYSFKSNFIFNIGLKNHAV